MVFYISSRAKFSAYAVIDVSGLRLHVFPCKLQLSIRTYHMEDEISKHAVKAYKTIKEPKLPFWHKVKEISIEVGIIIFAVTLSIWFHDISEHNHEQKDVRAFLVGLKKDLTDDIVQLQGDVDAYNQAGQTFTYLTIPTPGFKLSMDSVKKHKNYIYNTTSFVANIGRYEGFKSSGKLGNIEDDSLQNNITTLYQNIIPSLLASTNSYTQQKQYLFDYLNKSIKRNPDGTTNILSVLSSDEGVNICNNLTFITQITDRYKSAIKKSKEIISEINADYHLK